jgi:Putative Flp pilus-assembly TadE/G-like
VLRRVRDLRRDGGAIMVLFAVMVPLVLLPIGAIAIDVGYWFVMQRKVQATADAGALAAANAINGNPANASVVSQAAGYVKRNMETVTSPCGSPPCYRVDYPYDPAGTPNPVDGEVSEVEVEVRHPAGTFFGGIVGFLGVEVSRRAVAHQTRIPGTMAIYAHSTECDGGESMEFNGQDIGIQGWIHSEGGLSISTSAAPEQGFWAAKGTQRWRDATPPPLPVCPPSLNPSQNAVQFGPDPNNHRPDPVPPIDWPVWFRAAEFGFDLNAPTPNIADDANCRYKARTITVNDAKVVFSDPIAPTPAELPHSGTIASGIYCATGRFVLNAANVRGTITVLAREQIAVNGSGGVRNLQAFAKDLLFFHVPAADGGDPPHPSCDSTDNLRVDTGDGTWDGIIFDPCGRVLIDGSGNTVLRGSIVAEKFTLTDADFGLIGDEDFTATIELSLVE